MREKFEREKALVKYLLDRFTNLKGQVVDIRKPVGQENGVDVEVGLVDGLTIGIQVTEIDPYPKPGKKRGEEKTRAAQNEPYDFGQNDASIVLGTMARSVNRKVKIATRHSFAGFDEVWLLVCAGVPEHGAVVSTFVMTPWLSAQDLNLAPDNVLHESRYNRCFFLSILGAEEALYRWDRASRWRKSVRMEDIRHVPREAYISSLRKSSESWELAGSRSPVR